MTSNERTLKELYNDPAYAGGKVKFKAKLKANGYTFKSKEVDEFWKNAEVEQTYTKIDRNQIFRKITSPPNCYQIDLVFLFDKIYFTAINILSRKAYMFQIPNKEMKKSIIPAYKKFIDKAGNVKGVESDYEFSAKAFTDYSESRGIKCISDVAEKIHFTKTGDKLGIIDRFVRTIKGLILKQKAKTQNYDVDALVDAYNNNEHRGIGNQTPNTVNESMSKTGEIRTENAVYNLRIEDKVKLHDFVRTKLPKPVFGKESANWSSDIYVIVAKIRHKYRLLNEDNEELPRLYSANELLIVDISKLDTSERDRFERKEDTKKDEAKKEEAKKKRKEKKEGVDKKNIVEGKRLHHRTPAVERPKGTKIKQLDVSTGAVIKVFANIKAVKDYLNEKDGVKDRNGGLSQALRWGGVGYGYKWDWIPDT